MNPRERILGIIVGGLALLFGLYYAWSVVGGWYTLRAKEIARLQGEIEKQETLVANGREVARKFSVLEERSLPPNHELARSLYQTWLLDLVNEAKLAEANVNVTSARQMGKVYYRLTYSVSGKGSLTQLIELLHRFHSADYLHQVRSLRLRPVKGTRDLEVIMQIDAVSLPRAAEATKLHGLAAQRLPRGDSSAYVAAILGRNKFGPPNKPPQLARIGSQRGTRSRSVSFTAKATDADALDKITFSLGDDAPRGATIDPRSGSFRWTPAQTGTFSVTVIATDDGIPNRSVSEKVSISVSDPPPPTTRDPVARRDPPPARPTFDEAKHTYLIATTEVTGVRESWLSVRTSGKTLRLTEGDKFDIGSMQGVVTHIGAGEIEIEIEGKPMRLAIGEVLANATALPKTDLSSSESATRK